MVSLINIVLVRDSPVKPQQLSRAVLLLQALGMWCPVPCISCTGPGLPPAPWPLLIMAPCRARICLCTAVTTPSYTQDNPPVYSFSLSSLPWDCFWHREIKGGGCTLLWRGPVQRLHMLQCSPFLPGSACGVYLLIFFVQCHSRAVPVYVYSSDDHVW